MGRAFWIVAVCGWLGLGAASADEWLTNYDQAKEKAAAEHKPLLLDFTGSDWCGWCMKLDKETFQTPAFKNYARQNLVLVRLDYPKHKELPPDEQAQNRKLSGQYEIRSFPTVILIDAEEKTLYRGGYEEGGAPALIAKLRKAAPPAAKEKEAEADPFALTPPAS